MEIQVHNAGTKVVIANGTIGTQYPGTTEPRETYSLDADWLQQFRVCRFCGKQVSDEVLAWAYWKLQAPVCDTECLRAETLKRYACCDKARPLGCVCTYATTCPDHGEHHFGTHD